MAERVRIPLSKVYVDDEVKRAVLDVLDSGWFILGEKTKEFERKFADFCGTKYGIAVSSGTAAIFLSLLAIGIKPGDEVIVPSFSFIATASPILHLGAKPVFADINLKTYTIDPDNVRAKISSKTKAIIPVHLYGHPADMEPIIEIAEEKGLYIIEDACQAHGAVYKGKKVGSIGHVGCFSFYPSKNLTVCGDGGMVVTNNEEVAERIRMLRNHGRKEKYIHEIIGYNLRFNEIQAAIGLVQLQKLPYFIQQRRRIAKLYDELLTDLVIKPVEETWAKHVYHLYVIRTRLRDELRKYLLSHGVSTGIHYPIPIHKQPTILKTLRKHFKLPKSENAANTVLSLPIYPGLKEHQVVYVCDLINNFIQKNIEG